MPGEIRARAFAKQKEKGKRKCFVSLLYFKHFKNSCAEVALSCYGEAAGWLCIRK